MRSPADREDVSTQADALAFVREKAVKSVPGVNFRENIRNFAGVRANTDQSDFIIGETAPGFITLGGIKSPGLSSAPAIAEDALALVAGAGVTLEKKDELRPHPHQKTIQRNDAAAEGRRPSGKIRCTAVSSAGAKP